MKIIVKKGALEKRGKPWYGTWGESRTATGLASLGFLSLVTGLALFLLRNILSFPFLMVGPVLLLAAGLFELTGRSPSARSDRPTRTDRPPDKTPVSPGPP